MVAESARRVLVLPSMNVMGSISGFLDLVAYREMERKEGRMGKGGGMGEGEEGGEGKRKDGWWRDGGEGGEIITDHRLNHLLGEL